MSKIINDKIFGYFKEANSEAEYDPKHKYGYRTCPFCLMPVKAEEEMYTPSFNDFHEPICYFYSAHKKCYDDNPEGVVEIESRIIDQKPQEAGQ